MFCLKGVAEILRLVLIGLPFSLSLHVSASCIGWKGEILLICFMVEVSKSAGALDFEEGVEAPSGGRRTCESTLKELRRGWLSAGKDGRISRRFDR